MQGHKHRTRVSFTIRESHEWSDLASRRVMALFRRGESEPWVTGFHGGSPNCSLLERRVQAMIMPSKYTI